MDKDHFRYALDISFYEAPCLTQVDTEGAGVDGTPMGEYLVRHFEFEDEREIWLDYGNPELEGPL